MKQYHAHIVYDCLLRNQTKWNFFGPEFQRSGFEVEAGELKRGVSPFNFNRLLNTIIVPSKPPWEMSQVNEILLVDDDAVINMIHQKLLEKAYPGIIVKEFTNPELALTALLKTQSYKQKSPLILLDINMPEMDAWEFMDRLAEQAPGLKPPIAIVTSSIDQQDKDKAEQYELVRGFYVKPFSPIGLTLAQLAGIQNE